MGDGAREVTPGIRGRTLSPGFYTGKMTTDAEIKLFRKRVGPGTRLLGLDMGAKQIGVALSDIALTVATPLTVLKRGKFTATADEILKLMRKHQATGLIIGLPLEMSGKEGPSAQSAREFARNLAKIEDIPVLFVDERLSTAAVERTLLEADTSRARRKEVIDKMAAAYILQSALELIERDMFTPKEDA